MNMQFYMVPGSCSTGIHILLEHLDKIFEAHIINIPKGENKHPDYLAINPKATIPSLVLEDGTALTEFQSIAYYLAITHPEANLLPSEPIEAARTIETMAYVVNTVHGQGFSRIFATDDYLHNNTDRQDVVDKGMQIVTRGFEILNRTIDANPSSITVADAALFYVEFWADKINIPLPEKCQQHYNPYDNTMSSNVFYRKKAITSVSASSLRPQLLSIALNKILKSHLRTE